MATPQRYRTGCLARVLNTQETLRDEAELLRRVALQAPNLIRKGFAQCRCATQLHWLGDTTDTDRTRYWHLGTRGLCGDLSVELTIDTMAT
mgnify:CR=1 FL=1